MTRVGVISDTHGALPDDVADLFEGVEAIVHAGDVGEGWVLDRLRAIAPVHAVRGNCDNSGEVALLPPLLNVRLGGVRFLVTHQKRHLPRPLPAGVRVVVTGHSHRAREDREGEVLYLNPGSAGDPRFGLPVSVAVVTIEDGEPRAEIVEL